MDFSPTAPVETAYSSVTQAGKTWAEATKGGYTVADSTQYGSSTQLTSVSKHNNQMDEASSTPLRGSSRSVQGQTGLSDGGDSSLSHDHSQITAFTQAMSIAISVVEERMTEKIQAIQQNNEETIKKLQSEKDRQITQLEKSLADTFQRMELLLERLVGQNIGLNVTSVEEETTHEMNDSFLLDGLLDQEATQEQLVETEPTRDTKNESFLSDGSFFAEEPEQEQHTHTIHDNSEEINATSDMEGTLPESQKLPPQQAHPFPRGTGLDILVRPSQKQTGNPGKSTGKQQLRPAKAGNSFASRKKAPSQQTLFPHVRLTVKDTETTQKGRGNS
jgi:hypothetical protein